MTEIHPDFGELYPYSDHKRGDHISYRLEGHIKRGEILWVAAAPTLPNSRDFLPHYVVAPDKGGFLDMVLFSEVVMHKEPAMQKCPYCGNSHYDVEQCPLNPNRRV